MGIQGLLPLLKPIQRQRHLSEFAGQTLAVDAYVWLHRGAYACAVELAQERPTRRYVDFCMARIHLLRHHGVTPYLVFDGGPLPAKLGTEKEREKKRAENIKRANELMAQGKESQARDYYVKCVDVTPQMAYQVIKALKAENVPYVVAPYEADAQLAYLERIGLVQGVITEDSDLLVFGCRNVHLKLDTVSATFISISRADFGSPALAADSFSLIGWSDAQFRRMAMLSGCDYLPSIAGVGLKTAHQLLKKYKTVDKAVKMIQLEGKKTVPKGYLDSFYLAEKVFLHQRVFDPSLKTLVYLTSPPNNLGFNEDVEMYIGRYHEPTLAVRIAEGEACPISLTDMDDINPSFVPRTARALPLQNHDTNTSTTLRGKGPAERKGGILNFFTPVSKASPVKPPSSHSGHSHHTPTRIRRTQARAVPGSASGKRTLLDVMEHDIVTKRKKLCEEAETDWHQTAISTSRYFSRGGPSAIAHSKPASHMNTTEKEIDSPENRTEAKEFWNPVVQEDGYLSPSPSLSRDITPDLSSPAITRGTNLQRRSKASKDLPQDMSAQEIVERIFVRGSSEPIPDCDDNFVLGPDLTTNLAITDNDDDLEADRLSEPTSDILCWEDDDVDQQREGFPSPRGSVTPSLSANIEPTARTASLDSPMDELELLEIDQEDIWEEERCAVQARLAQKWKTTYSLGGRLAGVGSTNGSRIDPRSSTKIARHVRVNVTTVSASPMPQYSVRQRTARSNPKPLISESHSPVQHNLQVLSDSDRRVGSRSAPISIDVDEVSEEMVYSSVGRLQAFRFSM